MGVPAPCVIICFIISCLWTQGSKEGKVVQGMLSSNQTPSSITVKENLSLIWKKVVHLSDEALTNIWISFHLQCNENEILEISSGCNSLTPGGRSQLLLNKLSALTAFCAVLTTLRRSAVVLLFLDFWSTKVINVICDQSENHVINPMTVGHVNEYPTMHYFGNPQHTHSMIEFMILTKYFWKFQWKVALCIVSCYISLW